MPIIPDNIQKMMDEIKLWELGAGVFKENTPPHIFEMDREVGKWFHEAMDGIQ